jgi:hypothetical protein
MPVSVATSSGSKPWTFKLVRYFGIYSSIAMLFLGFSMTGIAFLYPCKLPLILGQLALSKETCASKLSLTTFLARLPVVLVESLLYLDTFIAGFYYSFCAVFSHLAVLWLKTKNVCPMIENPRGVLGKILKYKKLQIWDKTRDTFMMGRLMAFLMATTPMIEINCISALIIFGREMSLVESGFMYTTGAEAFVFTFLIQVGVAKVYVRSRRWLNNLGNLENRDTPMKVWKRVVRPLQPIKVHFGTNFVDELTPLIVQDFCWSQTASLVLMYRKSH